MGTRCPSSLSTTVASVRSVKLKAGHVQPVWAGHPWIYAQALEWVEGGAVAGDEVSVLDPHGTLLGRGFYSPGSAIPVRLLVRDAVTQLDLGFFRARLARAVELRRTLGLPSDETTGYRVVHAEGDGLAGLIVDRLGDVLCVQFSTFGMKAREGLVLEALREVLAPRAILDRTPASTARIEGFAPTAGVVRGEEVEALTFRERGLAYRIGLDVGQKTGFYFDLRPLREKVETLARGKKVLDTYAFVGSFAMAAARGGASEVVAVDESAVALETGAECARLNGVDGRITFVKQDVRKYLAAAKDPFDVVVVDPPRFAPRRGSRDSALVAYSRLAEGACHAVAPGGRLVLSSCSGAVDLGALTRALATGARRANVEATVLERGFQGADHPTTASFPEGLYLKWVIARIDAR
jgi:23S rRNA (cytosine1962-C5)-methyltransferase